MCHSVTVCDKHPSAYISGPIPFKANCLYIFFFISEIFPNNGGRRTARPVDLFCDKKNGSSKFCPRSEKPPLEKTAYDRLKFWQQRSGPFPYMQSRVVCSTGLDSSSVSLPQEGLKLISCLESESVPVSVRLLLSTQSENTVYGSESRQLTKVPPHLNLCCYVLQLGPVCDASRKLLRLSSNSYLVDPASSHMLVSKIKPCMSKYKPH